MPANGYTANDLSPAVSPWQNYVTIFANTLNNTTFRVSYFGVPAEACAKLAAIVTSVTGTSSSPIQMKTACGASGNLVVNNLLDSVAIGTACGLNTGAACQSVEFDFGL